MNGSVVAKGQAKLGEFDRECEELRPLGEAFVLHQFSGQLNQADAQDAVADVVARLLEHAAQGEVPKNLRAAFFAGVRNAAIDQLRLRGRRPTVALEAALDVPTDDDAPSEHAELREQRAVLGEALVSMARHYREAIVLHFGVGLTAPEIAKRQGIPLSAAKTHVFRGTKLVKQRLLDVTSFSHCEEMQAVGKRRLFERYAAQVATDEEAAQLEKHLEHCGRCKSVLLNLHHSLHELATSALVSSSVADQLTGRSGIADHLAGWVHSAGEGAHAAVEKARVGAFKLSNAIQGGEAAAGGALAGTSQKIAAICAGASVTAATCVGAGVVGPGIGIGQDNSGESPTIERTVPDTAGDTTAPQTGSPEASAKPADQDASAAASSKPAAQVNKEIGFEGAASTSSGGEFGGPSGGGGGGGGGSGGAGGFGFER